MNEHRYQLEKYKGRNTRHNCPNCEHLNTFTKYIDVSTGHYLSDKVGRCNRVEKCGYHYKPKDYFNDNELICPSTFIEIKKPIPKPVSFIPIDEVNKDFKSNNLYNFFSKVFDIKEVDEVFARYRIGSSMHWQHSTIFYQFDKYSRVRTGKIMLYNPDNGKRIKEPFNKIAWVHTTKENFNLQQCLFGEHLIYGTNKPIGIVESEKTALIMAITKPDFLWLATGGVCNLSIEKLKPLGHQQVILYPDSGAFETWSRKIQNNLGFTISSLLEKYPVGYDLADIIIEERTKIKTQLP